MTDTTAPPADRDLGKANAILRPAILRGQDIMEKIGHSIFICEVWRSPARQAYLYDQHVNHGGPQAIAPGHSKHEHTLPDGTPDSLACDVAFTNYWGGPPSPWDERHPWAVLRAVMTELCGLHAISEWKDGKLVGDRDHFEVSV